MNRTVITLVPIFILTASCGGGVASEGLHQNENAATSQDGQGGASSDAESSCPSTVAAFCAQPGVQCSDTWGAASASNPSCTQGGYDLVFFGESCGGYDLAGTLYWDDVQTYFVYDDATGALVGITSTTGTESQGGVHVVCSVGVPMPSADVACSGGHSCL
jgi:hypothetical protein